MLRFLTAGESHGPAETVILEGIPAGLPLSVADIQKELDKRKSGKGRGGRGAIETDQVEITSGIRNGITIGSPICMTVQNLDYGNWKDKDVPKVTNPRPGHADLAGYLKYGLDDVRNILERASARETVVRVAAGAVCKKLLSEFGIKIASHTVAIGRIKIEKKDYSFAEIEKSHEKNPDIRCLDEASATLMEQEILLAIKQKDTLGGIIEVVATGVPVGLGSYTHFDKRLDGLISQSLMSIPSVKSIEIGEGIDNAAKTGSGVQDPIEYKNNRLFRSSNHAGGIEGGVSNGEDIVCRLFLKPISTLGNPLMTIDLQSHKPVFALIERSDICVVPRAGVVAEAMMAFTLGKLFLEKFGNDSLHDIKYNFKGYMERIRL